MTYVTDLPNIVVVRTINDLPAPIGGVRTLAANTKYIFPGAKKPIMLTDILEFSDNSSVEDAWISTNSSIRAISTGGTIQFISSFNITYTGVGTLFTSTLLGVLASRLENGYIFAGPGSTIFGINSSNINRVFILDVVGIVTTGALGQINNVLVDIQRTTALNFSSGLSCSNNFGVNINGMRMATASSTTFFTSSGTTQGQVQIAGYSPVLQTATQYAFYFDPLTTHTGVSVSNCALSIIAPATTANIFQSGSLNNQTVGFKFIGNTYIPDSTVSINAYLNNNVTNTSIEAQNAWHVISSGVSWTSEYTERISLATDGTTTYLGQETVRLIADANIIFEPILATKEIAARFCGIDSVQRVVTFTNGTDVVNEIATPRNDGDVIIFKNSAGTMPTGLYKYIAYYVVNKAVDSFQLSYTPGGAAVLFTDDGTGPLSYQVCTLCGSSPQNAIAAGTPREVIPQAIGEMKPNCQMVVLVANLTDAVDILVSKAYYRLKK